MAAVEGGGFGSGAGGFGGEEGDAGGGGEVGGGRGGGGGGRGEGGEGVGGFGGGDEFAELFLEAEGADAARVAAVGVVAALHSVGRFVGHRKFWFGLEIGRNGVRREEVGK